MALGYSKAEMINEFYDSELYQLDTKTKNGRQNLIQKIIKQKIILEEVLDAKSEKVVIKLGDKIKYLNAKKLLNEGLKEILVSNQSLYGKFLHEEDINLNNTENEILKIGTELNETIINKILESEYIKNKNFSNN